MKRLFRLIQRPAQDQAITIVSGLPRSGTSMMMKMLEAGGMPVLTDHQRAPDEDNPKGYYEFERVKKLPEGDYAWLPEARGRVVKVISALLEHLPTNYDYRVIFMQRKMEEILASQKQMLLRANKPDEGISDDDLAAMYARHLASVQAWLAARPNFRVLYVDYNDLLVRPETHIPQINRFLGGRLDTDKMTYVVDPSLYRQRK